MDRTQRFAIAFATSGPPQVEILGAPDADLDCHVGPLTFPFDLCRERVEVRGLFARALAGDWSAPEPLGGGEPGVWGAAAPAAGV